MMVQREDFKLEKVTFQDADILFRLIQEMALAEGASREVITSPQIIRDTICNGTDAFAYLGYYNGKPMSYVIYYYTYSSYLGKKCLYLEDVFIKPIYQRLGLGKSVMKFMANVALESGCKRVDWTCLSTNTNAIQFYNHIGAEHLLTRQHFRLEQDKLAAFCSGD